jgi:hypothetical protein
MPSEPLDAIPLVGLFISIILLVLLCAEGGYRLGKYRGRQVQEKEAQVGEMITAMLGLLAFVLAFTFGLAAARFDTRRQVLLDEANAIGTTYLRAAMLPERRNEIRALLAEYVDTRLAAVESKKIAEGIVRSENLQNQLWEHAVAIAEKSPNSIIVGLFVQSLNEMIDLHAKRVTVGVRNRIPLAIWAALYGVSILSFATMGYYIGLTGTNRSPAIIAVALTFALVIGLIADLDRPQEGTLKVSQQALIDLRRSMN